MAINSCFIVNNLITGRCCRCLPIIKSCVVLFLICLLPSIRSYNDPPKLLTKQSDAQESRRVTKSGAAISVHCPVENPTRDIYFEWHKDGQPIEDFDHRVRVTNNGVLKIKQTMADDTGNYLCKAVNGFGSVEFAVTLIVLDDDYDENTEKDQNKGSHRESDSSVSADTSSKPVLTQWSKFSSLIQKPSKSNIRFKCMFAGNPRPTVTWYHNGDPLTDTESKRGRYYLVVNDLKPEDSGNYTCLANNAFGVAAKSYILEVIDNVKNKPEVDGIYPINKTVIIGESASFQCRFRSDEMPHIQWLKRLETKGKEGNSGDNSRNFNFGETDDTHIRVEGEMFDVLQSSAQMIESTDGLYINKLIISNTRLTDAGKYICLGANTMGYSYTSVFLSVVPSKPPTNTYSISGEELLPIPIVIAFMSVSVIIVIALMLWLCCYCQKRQTNNCRPTHSTTVYNPPSKRSRSTPSVTLSPAPNAKSPKRAPLMPSNESRESSHVYNELIFNDKRGPNVYQLYTNPIENHHSFHYNQKQQLRPYGYMC